MNSTSPLEVVDEVDLEKYMGKWYNIVHFPSTFLYGGDNIVEEFRLTDNNTIEVYKKCTKKSTGKVKTISGKASVVEGSNNAKLKIQFFWPIQVDYWIIDIEEDYKYASIGGPTRDYACILSRTPIPDEEIISRMIDSLERQGFDISRLQRTKHAKAE